jgi:hypothetical protein
VADTGFYPPRLAVPFDRLGWRYVRLHVAGGAAGTLVMPESVSAPGAGVPSRSQEPVEVRVEPRMVEREAVPT